MKIFIILLYIIAAILIATFLLSLPGKKTKKKAGDNVQGTNANDTSPEPPKKGWDRIGMGARIWLRFMVIQIFLIIIFFTWFTEHVWSTNFGMLLHAGVNGLLILLKGIRLKNPPKPELMEEVTDTLIGLSVFAVIGIIVARQFANFPLPKTTLFDYMAREKKTITLPFSKSNQPSAKATDFDSSLTSQQSIPGWNGPGNYSFKIISGDPQFVLQDGKSCPCSWFSQNKLRHFDNPPFAISGGTAEMVKQ